jgi:hypothetical protein
MNVAPKTRGTQIHPAWCAGAASASTIVSELMSRMNDVADVNGMSNKSFGPGPAWSGRPRYSRYAEMNAPKNRQSDDRKSHIATCRW